MSEADSTLPAPAPIPTHWRFQNLAGRKVGDWTVLYYAGRHESRSDSLWACRCVCGTEAVVAGGNLRKGGTKSCGCRKGQWISRNRPTHGGSYTPEYVNWRRMIQRCHNPDLRHYRRYGGRGIRVCERWRNSFAAFLADMGPRPSPRHTTIDRIDNDGHYEPGNCRWATNAEQQHNTCRSRLVAFEGKTMVAAEWSVIVGISAQTIRHRIFKSGWPVRDALMTPVQRGNRHRPNPII